MEGVYNTTKTNESWIDPIMTYIQNKNLFEDRLEAQKLQGVASKCTVLNGQLSRRLYFGPLLKCVRLR